MPPFYYSIVAACHCLCSYLLQLPVVLAPVVSYDTIIAATNAACNTERLQCDPVAGATQQLARVMPPTPCANSASL